MIIWWPNLQSRAQSPFYIFCTSCTGELTVAHVHLPIYLFQLTLHILKREPHYSASHNCNPSSLCAVSWLVCTSCILLQVCFSKVPLACLIAIVSITSSAEGVLYCQVSWELFVFTGLFRVVASLNESLWLPSDERNSPFRLGILRMLRTGRACKQSRTWYSTSQQ